MELRPVERRVLKLFNKGLSTQQISTKFLRSDEWVEQVARLAEYKLDKAQDDPNA